jgi:hypothetical protein
MWKIPFHSATTKMADAQRDGFQRDTPQKSDRKSANGACVNLFGKSTADSFLPAECKHENRRARR